LDRQMSASAERVHSWNDVLRTTAVGVNSWTVDHNKCYVAANVFHWDELRP